MTRTGLRLLTDAATYAAAAILAKIAALLTVPFLTRALSPADYGLADLAISVSALLVVVTQFAGDIPAARLMAAEQDSRARRRIAGAYVTATAVVSTGIAVLLLPAADELATKLWAAPQAGGLALLALVLVPLSAVQAALAQIQRLAGRPKKFAVIATVDLVAQLTLAVALVAAGFGPSGVIVGFVLGSVVGLGASAWAAASDLAPPESLKSIKRIVAGGLPYLPTAVLFLMADNVARILVADALGAQAVGHLAVAFRLASVTSLATAAFSLAWGPLGLALEVSERTARLLGTLIRLYGGGIALGAAAIGAVAPELTRLVAGEDYVPGSTVAPGLLVASALAGPLYVLMTAAAIGGRGSRVPLAAAAGSALQVAISAALVRAVGLAGIGVGAVAGQLVAVLVLSVSVRHVVAGGWVRFALTLATASILAMLAQWLNSEPEQMAVWRVLLAVAAVGASMLLIGEAWTKVWRPLRAERRPTR